MKATSNTPDQVPKLNTKVYFLRVSGKNHQAVKELSEQLGIGMNKLSDMLIETAVNKIRTEETVNIEVRRLKDGSADMKIQ